MSHIQTYSGQLFSFIDPQPEDVQIVDIVNALSKICRFTGATTSFYSVAQHSIWVSDFVLSKDGFDGLMHDAGEAYYGDISTPLKRALEQCAGDSWKTILDRVDRVIADVFGLKQPIPMSIKYADKVALATERRDLMFPCGFDWVIDLPEPDHKKIISWPPDVALERFDKCFTELKS